MAIKQHLEEAMQKIVAERDREVAVVKQKTTQEVIVPHNAEIDKASNTAIAKLQKEFTEKTNAEQQAHNQRVVMLQQEFTNRKQEIIEAATAEKEEFSQTTLTTACAEIMFKYDSEISKVREQIQDLKE